MKNPNLNLNLEYWIRPLLYEKAVMHLPEALFPRIWPPVVLFGSRHRLAVTD